MEMTCVAWTFKIKPLDLNNMCITLIDEMEKNNVESYTNYTSNGMKKKVAFIHKDENEASFIENGEINKIFLKTRAQSSTPMGSYSVFIFKTGAVKISCKNLSEKFPDTTEMLMKDINITTEKMVKIIGGEQITEPKISLINVQTKLDDFPLASKFFKVVEPNSQKKGWRVYRFYVFKGRKFHFAVDKYKRCQIFGAKNIEEILYHYK